MHAKTGTAQTSAATAAAVAACCSGGHTRAPGQQFWPIHCKHTCTDRHWQAAWLQRSRLPDMSQIHIWSTPRASSIRWLALARIRTHQLQSSSCAVVRSNSRAWYCCAPRVWCDRQWL